MVERKPEELSVVGSIPTPGTNLIQSYICQMNKIQELLILEEAYEKINFDDCIDANERCGCRRRRLDLKVGDF